MVLSHAGPLPLAGRPGLPEVESAAAGLLCGGGRPLAGRGRCCVSPYRPSHEETGIWGWRTIAEDHVRDGPGITACRRIGDWRPPAPGG
jgi:hypothetical protein